MQLCVSLSTLESEMRESPYFLPALLPTRKSPEGLNACFLSSKHVLFTQALHWREVTTTATAKQSRFNQLRLQENPPPLSFSLFTAQRASLATIGGRSRGERSAKRTPLPACQVPFLRFSFLFSPFQSNNAAEADCMQGASVSEEAEE